MFLYFATLLNRIPFYAIPLNAKCFNVLSSTWFLPFRHSKGFINGISLAFSESILNLITFSQSNNFSGGFFAHIYIVHVAIMRFFCRLDLKDSWK